MFNVDDVGPTFSDFGNMYIYKKLYSYFMDRSKYIAPRFADS